jgi:hypothetical protein
MSSPCTGVFFRFVLVEEPVEESWARSRSDTRSDSRSDSRSGRSVFTKTSTEKRIRFEPKSPQELAGISPLNKLKMVRLLTTESEEILHEFFRAIRERNFWESGLIMVDSVSQVPYILYPMHCTNGGLCTVAGGRTRQDIREVQQEDG